MSNSVANSNGRRGGIGIWSVDIRRRESIGKVSTHGANVARADREIARV